MTGPDASRVATRFQVAVMSQPRPLVKWEVEAVIERFQRHQGLTNRDTKLRIGQPFMYKGRKWLVYDWDMYSDAPSGVLMHVVSPTFDEILGPIEPSEGEALPYARLRLG